MAVQYNTSTVQNKPLDPHTQKILWNIFCGKIMSYFLKNIITRNRR